MKQILHTEMVKQEIIRVKCIKHVYPDNTEVKVCGLDFVVRENERVVILGPNGAGKTTLLNHILGILAPVEGEVKVFGQEPAREQKKVIKNIGVVFQNVDEQIIGPTVYDDIAFSPRNYRYPRKEVENLVTEISEKLGISHLLSKIPHYLSGGQKKKVALAGAMVLKPKLLILDEPFNGLDPESKEEIIQLLMEINRFYGTALLLASHDINYLPEIVDKAYILNSGKILRYGKIEEVFQDIDFLRQVSLRPPFIAELFARLKNKGIAVEIPLTIEQAERELFRLLGLSIEKHFN